MYLIPMTPKTLDFIKLITGEHFYLGDSLTWLVFEGQNKPPVIIDQKTRSGPEYIWIPSINVNIR